MQTYTAQYMHIQIPVTDISLSPCCVVITVVNVKSIHMVGYNNDEPIRGIGSRTVQAIL